MTGGKAGRRGSEVVGKRRSMEYEMQWSTNTCIDIQALGELLLGRRRYCQNIWPCKISPGCNNKVNMVSTTVKSWKNSTPNRAFCDVVLDHANVQEHKHTDPLKRTELYKFQTIVPALVL
jgi:hypothetical protein